MPAFVASAIAGAEATDRRAGRPATTRATTPVRVGAFSLGRARRAARTDGDRNSSGDVCAAAPLRDIPHLCRRASARAAPAAPAVLRARTTAHRGGLGVRASATPPSSPSPFHRVRQGDADSAGGQSDAGTSQHAQSRPQPSQSRSQWQPAQRPSSSSSPELAPPTTRQPAPSSASPGQWQRPAPPSTSAPASRQSPQSPPPPPPPPQQQQQQQQQRQHTPAPAPAPAPAPSPESSSGTPCVVKVFGVGGGGGNAVMRMLDDNIDSVRFAVANTDHQVLEKTFRPYFAPHPHNNGDGRAVKSAGHGPLLESVVALGTNTCRGLGAGGSPEVGFNAAHESYDEIAHAIGHDTDLVFITAGMGGGTGTGAAPVVAQVARSFGALTVGVVTKPFAFEGRRRMQQAMDGIATLREQVDTLIVISNDRLLETVPRNTPLKRAFNVADDVLKHGVRGISEIITRPGLINVDFADVKSVMAEKGHALLGLGVGEGEHRAREAAIAAVSSPLLDFPLRSARGAVFNISGGGDLKLSEVNECAEVIYQHLDEDASIIFGATVDESLGPRAPISVTVVATGFA